MNRNEWYFLCTVKAQCADNTVHEEHYLIRDMNFGAASIRLAAATAHMALLVGVQHVKTRIYPFISVDLLARHAGSAPFTLRLSDFHFESYHAQIISRLAEADSCGTT